ncbi:aldolase [Sphingomonas naphthae]|uniref:3-oxo-tetronate 4-phosphate decarboxylase n=1 Tax=Sphingomonas naphthae TaxID=1813468 RepID=A0ABY7TP29_9SPHN|nr:3-oxo-tetronate 4-phosphate decarboxylase [Sphingomonas naphthae]WCT74155.1 aldolase [Sphingomonas naphthae]
MTDREAAARAEMVESGRSLFDRGLATGSSGNISVRLEDGTILITPTDISLGALDPDAIAKVDAAGAVIGGPKPSKEAFLHRAIYAARPAAQGIVHLHATHSAAISCMAGLSPDDCLPPLTAYFVMKIGRLPLIPYHRPGDERLTDAIMRIAPDHPAMLLANHGPIVSGASLRHAMNRIEELEETAKLFLLLRGSPTSPLTPDQIDDLDATFGAASQS